MGVRNMNDLMTALEKIAMRQIIDRMHEIERKNKAVRPFTEIFKFLDLDGEDEYKTYIFWCCKCSNGNYEWFVYSLEDEHRYLKEIEAYRLGDNRVYISVNEIRLYMEA